MTDAEIVLPNATATQVFGDYLGRSLPAGTVLLLQGDLGSGKTTLVQGIGAGLGITDTILSPTFTLVSEYFEGRIPLYHLDLYRLDPAEADQLNVESYWDGIETPLGIVAIEWAERLNTPPDHYLTIQLAIAPANGRHLHMTAKGHAIALLNHLIPFQELALPE
jgi:tRNA threonylcarbamoyladenosine biosynthesis protein TsaE